MIIIDDVKKLHDVPQHVFRNKSGCYSDEVYTFDIETTSLFKIDGVFQPFDRNIADYSNIEKVALPYIGMFSVNGTVYGFRKMEMLKDILEKIASTQICKFVYVHNLGYEFQFYQWLFREYTITDMIARKPRSPIQFHIEELNITFRCSYALTNLGLDASAKRYTNIEKKTGQLDYNVARSTLTPLTEKELEYCEYDCLTLYEIIKTFRKEYGHIKKIPLTQTGEMRRALKAIVPPWHNSFIKKLTPTLKEYKRLRELFAGGICHTNYLLQGLVFAGFGFDICSSYPFEMISKKLPMEKFVFLRDHSKIKNYPDADYAKIYVVSFTGAKSKLFNSFMQISKLRNAKGIVNDNGRVIYVESAETTINEIDLEVLNMCYTFESFKFLEIWVAKKDYLPRYMIEFILSLYIDKTTLKGIDDPYTYSIYMKKKQLANSAYGACVTNIVKSSIIFNKDGWKTGKFTDELIKEKLKEIKQGYNNLFSYAWGCWVTSYARRHLVRPIATTDLDLCVGYFDTDSHKNDDSVMSFEEQEKIYIEENKRADMELLQMCVARKIDFAKTRPKDIHGKEHPLGYYECEGYFSEFKALGAKRYCYRQDGKLKITIAGVGKKGVTALKDNINNFNEKLFFGYDDAHKNCSYYIDNQKPFTFKDCNGVEFRSTWQTSIALAPTTYSMSLPPIYEMLAGEVSRKLSEDENFLELYKSGTYRHKKLRQRKN